MSEALLGAAASHDRRSSLLLLKPDCLDRNLQPAVAAEVEAKRLRIVCRHDGMLSASELECLLPRMTPHEHPLEFALLGACYEDRRVEIWILESDGDAIADALAVREVVRAAHAPSRIVNTIHAPDSPGEFRRQASLLARSCTRCRPLERNNSGATLERAPSTPILPPRLREPAVLRRAVHRLWVDRDSPLWRPTPPEPLHVRPDGPAAVWVADVGRLLAIDNYAGALLEAFPDASLDWAVRFVLGLFDYRQAVVCRTASTRAADIARTLSRCGVDSWVGH